MLLVPLSAELARDERIDIEDGDRHRAGGFLGDDDVLYL